MWWRMLARIGAYLHTLPSPKPPGPSFTRSFPTSIIRESVGSIVHLHFYVPPNYVEQRQRGKRYPVVVNLHGGGFTLGTPTDDARWARMVLQELDAVVVSVEYSLAPEHPYPAAVEDGLEALLHLAVEADEHGIDPTRMALSGFSAGGNLAFTIPMKLYIHLESLINKAASQRFIINGLQSTTIPRIVSIVSWYPILDFTISRDLRRSNSRRPEKTLPPFLTNLFDRSYLPSHKEINSPFVSPANAPDEMLIRALPSDIAMYVCEWDMLHEEGTRFAHRLQGLGKRVECTSIEGKPHAFDKAPNPFSVDPQIDILYKAACVTLRRGFHGKGSGPSLI